MSTPLPHKAEDALSALGVDFTPQADGSLLVKGNLDLGAKNLKILPDLSSVVVTGHFMCRYNYLTSLKGSPKKVGGSYFCNGNQLETLEHATQDVGKDFFSGNNPLKSLEYAPQVFNKLESDLGNFRSWDDVPEELRMTPESKTRLIEEISRQITTLTRPVKAPRRARFKNNNSL